MSIPTARVGFASDYNDLYTTRLRPVGQLGGAQAFSDLVNWRYEVGQDWHSQVADPDLIDIDGGRRYPGLQLRTRQRLCSDDRRRRGMRALLSTQSPIGTTGPAGRDGDSVQTSDMSGDRTATWTFSGLDPNGWYDSGRHLAGRWEQYLPGPLLRSRRRRRGPFWSPRPVWISVRFPWAFNYDEDRLATAGLLPAGRHQPGGRSLELLRLRRQHGRRCGGSSAGSRATMGPTMISTCRAPRRRSMREVSKITVFRNRVPTANGSTRDMRGNTAQAAQSASQLVQVPQSQRLGEV